MLRGTFQFLHLYTNTNVSILRCRDVLIFQLSCRIFRLTVILSLEFCISMFINLYIARPTYFFLIYTCGLAVLLNEYVMLCYVMNAMRAKNYCQRRVRRCCSLTFVLPHTSTESSRSETVRSEIGSRIHEKKPS